MGIVLNILCVGTVALFLKFYGVAATECYICRGTDTEKGVFEHVSCPDINDARTTTKVNCVSTDGKGESRPCVTFVGSQRWGSDGSSIERDGVVRLCANSHTIRTFLKVSTNSIFIPATPSRWPVCEARDIAVDLPDPNPNSLTQVVSSGRYCVCNTNLCNGRFNFTERWTNNSSPKTSATWTIMTSMALTVALATGSTWRA